MTIDEIGSLLWLIVLPAVVATGFATFVGAVLMRKNTRRQIPEMLGYLLAFSCLGVVTGFASGNSREAVLGAVLPALLTLVSGLIGYLFSKDGLSAMRPAIPHCILVLCVGALLGLALGSNLRGKFDQNARQYQQFLLRFQQIDLKCEKALFLAKLEVWKRQELAAIPVSSKAVIDSPPVDLRSTPKVE